MSDDESDAFDERGDEANPLGDLSPFANGDEGTNIDEDSPYDFDDSEYAEAAAAVYDDLLARTGESMPQPRLEPTRRVVELLGDAGTVEDTVGVAVTVAAVLVRLTSSTVMRFSPVALLA